MTWKAFFQSLIVAAVNVAFGILVKKYTGSDAAAAASAGAGTLVAHAMRSPYHP